MKKNYSTISFASLLFCMLAVFSLSFVSCSDDDEVKYMEEDVILEDNDVYRKYISAVWYNNIEKRTMEVTDVKSRLEYDELIGKWVLVSYDTPLGTVVIELDNVKEDLKQYANENGVYYGYFFSVSGKCTYEYSIQFYPEEGAICGTTPISFIYSIKLKNMELLPLVEE